MEFQFRCQSITIRTCWCYWEERLFTSRCDWEELTYISPSLPRMAPPSTAVGPPSETRTTSTLDCFTLLLARHLMDVSCYIGPSMPSGIYNIIQYNIGPEWHLFYVSGTSYRGDARGLWINASPRESSLVKFHLSEFRIWKGFSPWRKRGSVACHLLWMKTSATYPKPQVASQHLDGTWTRRPSPLPTAMRARLVPRPHFVRDRYTPIHGLDLHPRFEFASGFHMAMAGVDTSNLLTRLSIKSSFNTGGSVWKIIVLQCKPKTK